MPRTWRGSSTPCSPAAAMPTVLDSYAEERLPHARAVIDLSIELGKIICVPDPAEAAARDELMSAGVTDGRTVDPAACPRSPGRCSRPAIPSPATCSRRARRRRRRPSAFRRRARRRLAAGDRQHRSRSNSSRRWRTGSVANRRHDRRRHAGCRRRRHVRLLVRRARVHLGVAAPRLPRPRRRHRRPTEPAALLADLRHRSDLPHPRPTEQPRGERHEDRQRQRTCHARGG